MWCLLLLQLESEGAQMMWVRAETVTTTASGQDTSVIVTSSVGGTTCCNGKTCTSGGKHPMGNMGPEGKGSRMLYM